MSDVRNNARTMVSLAARAARDTSAHRRYGVRSVNDDGTLQVALAHWPADKSIKVPRGTREPVLEGDWVLCSHVDGTLEAHGFSAYGGGALPSL
mgnify:CR=1 FL=1